MAIGRDPGLGPLLADLSAAAVAAQRDLDTVHLVELSRIARHARGLDIADHRLLALLPPHLRIDTITISASMTIEAQRKAGASVGLSIAAQPVHNFAWQRFGLDERQIGRVTIDVQAAPRGGLPAQGSVPEEEQGN